MSVWQIYPRTYLDIWNIYQKADAYIYTDMIVLPYDSYWIKRVTIEKIKTEIKWWLKKKVLFFNKKDTIFVKCLDPEKLFWSMKVIKSVLNFYSTWVNDAFERLPVSEGINSSVVSHLVLTWFIKIIKYCSFMN